MYPLRTLKSFVESLIFLQLLFFDCSEGAKLFQLLPRKEIALDSCPGMTLELLNVCNSRSNSCRGQCGTHSMVEGDGLKMCSCDKYCLVMDDCCADFAHHCPQLVEHALKTREVTTVTVSCILGYKMITSCPKDWDPISVDQATVPQIPEYKSVTDLSSTLPFRSTKYFICNGGDPTKLEIWQTKMIAGRLSPQSNRSRLCGLVPYLSCSQEFRSRDLECDYPYIQVATESICSMFYSKNITEALREHLIEPSNISSNDVDRARSNSSVAVSDQNTTYTISCSLKITGEHYQGRLSTLFQLPEHDTIYGVIRNQARFTSWCPAGGQTSGCPNRVCPPYTVKKNDLCEDISTYFINFKYKVKEPGCSDNKLLSWLLTAILNNNNFLQVSNISRTDSDWKIELMVNTDLARSHMNDSYLRPQLKQARKLSLLHRKLLSLQHFEVCPNKVTTLCKVLYNVNDPFEQDSQPTANKQDSQINHSGMINDVHSKSAIQPMKSARLGNISSKNPLQRARDSAGKIQVSCCFCRLIKTSVENRSKDNEMECSVLDLFVLFNMNGPLMSDLLRHLGSFDNIEKAVGQGSWLSRCFSAIQTNTKDTDVAKLCEEKVSCNSMPSTFKDLETNIRLSNAGSCRAVVAKSTLGLLWILMLLCK